MQAVVLSVEAGPLGAYHPGNGIATAADGSGYLLKKGETVKVRVFYTKEEGWEEITDDFGRESQAAIYQLSLGITN